MQILVAQNDQEWANIAAEEISSQVKQNPASRLSFATGATTLPLFEELNRSFQAGRVDFSRVRCFQLDEYCSLGSSHPASCAYTLINRFFDRVNILPENCHFLDGLQADREALCRDYDELMRQNGGLDLQVLGIGLNGHLGFNQPGTLFDAETHPARVDDITWRKNLKYFKTEKENPRDALTMGLAAIMRSKRAILLAKGKVKEEILRQALFGPVIPEVPASILQRHPNAIVLLDPSLIKLKTG